jgi:hypothetical protein
MWSKARRIFDRRSRSKENNNESTEQEELNERVQAWIRDSRMAEFASRGRAEIAELKKPQDSAQEDVSKVETTGIEVPEQRPFGTIHQNIINAVSAMQEGFVNFPSGLLEQAESIADAWSSTATACAISQNKSKPRMLVGKPRERAAQLERGTSSFDGPLRISPTRLPCRHQDGQRSPALNLRQVPWNDALAHEKQLSI